MNHRLQQFIAAENITQSEFADSINVARASVSHVLAGRNNPGYDFIRNISSQYPNLSLDWLINGKGKMYKSPTAEIPAEPVKLTKSKGVESIFSDELFENENIFGNGCENISLKPVNNTEITSIQEPCRKMDKAVNTADQADILCSPSRGTAADKKEKSISRIVVFYDDGTFQELNR